VAKQWPDFPDYDEVEAAIDGLRSPNRF